jgi:uncharacterized protein YqjF (DUF2071 family)
MSRTFLQADWRKLVMANYSVDQAILLPYLPYRTELDLWKGTCYVSLVGFMFLNTKVKGIGIPFHTRVEEVNLRFYVRYRDQGAWKRGTVFIKEIVPKPAISFVANTIYQEHYETLPMSHSWNSLGESLRVEYRWKKKAWNSIQIKAGKMATTIAEGSEEEFITEHYWGYTRIADQKTAEYGVEHPRWEVYPTQNYAIDVDFGDVYGLDFAFLRTQTPASVFLAEGSEIKVKAGRRV